MTKLKKKHAKKPTAKEYLMDNFISKGYTPVRNDDGSYSWYNNDTKEYYSGNNGGLTEKNKYNIFNRKFNREVSDEVNNYLNSNNSKPLGTNPASIYGAVDVPTEVDKLRPRKEKTTENRATYVPPILEENRINDLPAGAAQTGKELVEKKIKVDEVTKKDAELADKRATAKTVDFYIKDPNKPHGFTPHHSSQVYLANEEYKLPSSLDSNYTKEEAARLYDAFYNTFPAESKTVFGSKYRYANDAFFKFIDDLNENVASRRVYKHVKNPDIAKQFDATKTPVQDVIDRWRPKYTQVNGKWYLAEDVKQREAAKKHRNSEFKKASSGKSSSFKNGGRLIPKAYQGTKFINDKYTLGEHAINLGSKLIEPALDIALYVNQNKLIDKVADARKNIPTLNRSYTEHAIRPIQGLPKEVLDNINNVINNTHNTIASSDPALVARSAAINAANKEKLVNNLISAQAKVVTADTARFDKESNANQTRYNNTRNANEVGIYNKAIHNSNTEASRLQQKRVLNSTFTTQLLKNLSTRANYAMQSKLAENRNKATTLVANRAHLESLLASGKYDNSTTVKDDIYSKIDVINTELKSLAKKGMPTMNDSYGAALTGKFIIE